LYQLPIPYLHRTLSWA